MRKTRYTLYFIPENDKDTRVYSVSKFSIMAIIIVFVFFVASSIISSIFLVNIYDKYKTASLDLERELSNNVLLRNEKSLKVDQLMHIDRKVDNLNDMSSKLFTMAGLSPNIHDHTSSGRGGQAPNEFRSSEKSYRLFYLNMLTTQKKQYIESLMDQVENLSESYYFIENIINENKQILSHIPTITPTTGYISSPYGYRRSPFTGRREFHRGIDISAPMGTLIYAPADGKVVFTGNKAGFGKTIVIEHGFGYVTRYAHLRDFNIKRWDDVKRGDVIGYVGNTGRSTGPHLHYGVIYQGIHVNPSRYFFDTID